MRFAALTAALVAAAVVPGGAPGVGIVVVALLVAVAAWLGTGSSLDLWLFGTAALALAGIAAVSDAGWVVAIDLSAAILLGTLAVGGATLLAPIAPARALRSVPEITPRPNAAVVPVARGIGLVGIVTVPFAALLISADAAFAAIADGIPFPATDLWPARGVVFVVVLAGALGLGLVRREQFRQLSLERSRALRPIEWMLPLGALVALFVAFVGVQVTVLFGGRDHVLRTTGLTYAEYARSGYWQLLATAVLTLGVIAAALRLADTPRRSHRVILRALLAALCGLTLVLLASALHRLDLYESAFGLTRLRLTAEAFAWGLAGFFALIVLAGVVPTVRRNFARTAIAATAAGLLAFSLANPDGTIARQNIERWRTTGSLDVAYLQTLSADAAPSIAELPPELARRGPRPARRPPRDRRRLGLAQPLTAPGARRSSPHRDRAPVTGFILSSGLPAPRASKLERVTALAIVQIGHPTLRARAREVTRRGARLGRAPAHLRRPGRDHARGERRRARRSPGRHPAADLRRRGR